MQAVEVGVNHQLIALFNALFKKKGLGNHITSPLSVYAALALVAEGSSGPGLAELQKAFGFGQPGAIHSAQTHQALESLHLGKATGVTVKMSNAIYFQNGFAVKDEYKQAVTKTHHAHAENVDFASPATLTLINDRITKATDGLLKNTIGQLDSNTVSVLVNTVYFKGFWLAAFDHKLTSKQDFHLADNSVVKVDMMSANKVKAASLEAQGRRLLSLPYKGGEIKFVVELPTDHKLVSSSEDLVLQVVGMHEINHNVKLPKFKAKFHDEISPVLQGLGVKGIFSPGTLTGISNEAIAVTQVIHQAFIQVDEEGTEAAAATAVVMSRCLPAPPPEFNVNSPFFFHIVDSKNHLILFSGSIAKPEFA